MDTNPDLSIYLSVSRWRTSLDSKMIYFYFGSTTLSRKGRDDKFILRIETAAAHPMDLLSFALQVTERLTLFLLARAKQQVIPAFEEAIQTMKVGGIRRLIVPTEIGYPENNWKKKDPKPSTFAGKRSLSFVLENQGLIDKTLLFDIELLKIVE